MQYFGENLHKTKVFLHKSEKYAKRGEPAFFVLCQNVYPFNQNT